MLNTNSTRTYEARQLTLLYFLWQVKKGKLVIMRKTQHLRTHFLKLFSQSKKRQLLCRPGIEPVSTAWKAAIIMPTTIPPTL